MPAASEALTRARREEIINACAELYKTMGFREISLKDIAQRTSFTRTSIYNYFQTKEEIFLALLAREHDAWAADMEDMASAHDALSAGAFADAFARALEKRACMLKLMCMNLYDMEGNSRIENLVAFKASYARAMRAIEACLVKFFPQMTEMDRRAFLYAVLPFLFGVYPYTTEKQKEAMALAHVPHVSHTIYEITRSLVGRLLPA